MITFFVHFSPLIYHIMATAVFFFRFLRVFSIWVTVYATSIWLTLSWCRPRGGAGFDDWITWMTISHFPFPFVFFFAAPNWQFSGVMRICFYHICYVTSRLLFTRYQTQWHIRKSALPIPYLVLLTRVTHHLRLFLLSLSCWNIIDSPYHHFLCRFDPPRSPLSFIFYKSRFPYRSLSIMWFLPMSLTSLH